MEPHDTRAPSGDALEKQIQAWRGHLRGSRAISASDADELEDHLREQVATLGERGLADDEAFLVAVKRIGAIDALTREYAREHSERLWKQLVLAGDGGPGTATGVEPRSGYGARTMWVALALAMAAGVAMKIPGLFGVPFDPDQSLFYPLNIAFLTLPFVVAFFAWQRPVATTARLGLLGAFGLAALAVNTFPFPGENSSTLGLTIMHVPIVLWMGVGVAYVGGRWVGSERRMDFIRFTGEFFIYYVLIALGGGVLIGVTFALFEAIALDVEPLVQNWILPCGIAGAVVVAAWLVEAKQSVIENMAPVLARIFVPLFTLVLLAFVVTMVVTGRGIDVEREVLIAIDLLLVVVFGLLLYSISARDPLAPVGALDWIQLVLVAAALLVDVLALWAIGARISDFGFTPNRLAALGMNVVLLVNLAGAAVLYLRVLRGGTGIARVWDWQVGYLYVIAAWAAVVAFGFPLLFGFE
jgi:hypothetical protein